MNQVVLISNENDFAASFRQALSEHLGCIVVWVTDLQIPPAVLSQSGTLFVIVDTHSLSIARSSVFPQLYKLSPDANVIALAEPGHGLDTEGPFLRGIHEVVRRPGGIDEFPAAAQRIAESIHSFIFAENVRHQMSSDVGCDRIVAKSKRMRELVRGLPVLANSEATILLEGETGTGKDLFARAIHYLGPHAGGPFVTVDCGAIPEQLMENELFGHVRGAYTGAADQCRGLLHEAQEGTLYLDEVEALTLPVQTRFLRFLQEHQYRPLGQSSYRSVHARVIASANVDLQDAVRQKTFRMDLFYRLSVVRVVLPPLRDRRSDIPPLAAHFLHLHDTGGSTPAQFPQELLDFWMDSEWPGNVRELESRVQEWLLHSRMDPETQLLPTAAETSEVILTLAGVRETALEKSESPYFARLLGLTGGNVSRAAHLAGVNRKSLTILLKKRGIDPSRFRSH